MQLNNDGLMWALVKEKSEEGLWMKRVPIPEVGPNDVKIKIHKTATAWGCDLTHGYIEINADYRS